MQNNKRVLVTSGPTRAYFDAIRYMANTSSGALGAKMVEVLHKAGMPVTHIRGMGSEQARIRTGEAVGDIEISTVDDLLEVVDSTVARGNIDAVIHAMAVLDYVPENRMEEKKASGDDFWDIRLVRTPKVIALMREALPDAFFVGFKLEKGLSDTDLIDRAMTLMRNNNLDAVVANILEDVSPDRHRALVITSDGNVCARPETKNAIAREVARLVQRNMTG